MAALAGRLQARLVGVWAGTACRVVHVPVDTVAARVAALVAQAMTVETLEAREAVRGVMAAAVALWAAVESQVEVCKGVWRAARVLVAVSLAVMGVLVAMDKCRM